MECGILVPQAGIETMTPGVETWSLNHQTTRGVPRSNLSWKNVKISEL